MTTPRDPSTLIRLTRILYDPASWMPASALACVVPAQVARLHAADARALATPWINQLIINTLASESDAQPLDEDAIDGFSVSRIETCDPALRWLQQWEHLRRIAYLIGCRAMRDALVATRHYIRLDERARAFALLPVMAPRALFTLTGECAIDQTTLVAQGYACLSNAMRTDLLGIDDRIDPCNEPHTDPRADAHINPGNRACRALCAALHARLQLMFADTHAVLHGTEPSEPHARFPTLLEAAFYDAKTPAHHRPAARA